MNLNKLLVHLNVISSVSIIVTGCLPPLLAQPVQEWKVSIKFPPTEDRGSPDRTLGAGARLIDLPAPPPMSMPIIMPPRNIPITGNDNRPIINRQPNRESCSTEGKIPLTALMPTRQNIGKTSIANPAFFWYIPKTNAKAAEFVLIDSNKNKVYQKNFVLSGEAGVIKLILPSKVSLKIGQTYLWELAIICSPENRSSDRYVQGMIQMTELSASVRADLQKSISIEQAKTYAKLGIWHDTLTILSELRHYKPTEWEELLKSVGLEAIASAPLIEFIQ